MEKSMELQPVSDTCHTAVRAQEHARYMLLKSQIVEAAKLGLRGIAIDGTLTKEDEDYLREQGYDVFTPDAENPSPLGYHLIVLW